MSSDRYSRIVLTVIACALVYLCVVLTPWPGVQAQVALRPGDPTGPGEVVIVGWRAPLTDRVPIITGQPIPVAITGPPVQITGQVTTERSTGRADRMVLVGWEEHSDPRAAARFQWLDPNNTAAMKGLPVNVVAR